MSHSVSALGAGPGAAARSAAGWSPHAVESGPAGTGLSPLPTVASPASRAVLALVLVSAIAVLATRVPTEVYNPLSPVFLLSIGIVGAWRYSWWSLHALRALYYLKVRFPRIRRAADAATGTTVDHVYCLVTSYAMQPEVTWSVYRGILTELKAYGRPATLVAAVSHQTDVDVLRRAAMAVGLPDDIEFVFMYQDGTGKRPAMGEALRAISRRMPTEESVCIFMDGDVLVRPGILSKVLPIFEMRPDVGAATTDNRGITDGGNWTREWYDLRFTQRHLLMSSMALSDKLLVLTGRFSVIRATLAVDPSFIAQLEHDAIEHWRHGRIEFLSGDDKSTWFWLLKRRWNMVYVPDARADSFEELPASLLPVGAVSLSKRWYGNMLRTNGRAVALGPARMGLFVWWCLVDQRISMWTSFVGPVVAVILAITYRADFLLVYALWILSTRSLLATVLGTLRRRWAAHWPFLLFFNQLTGAVVKTYVAFHLDRQRWTRQNIGGDGGARDFESSGVLHFLTMAGFVSLLAFYSGAIEMPGTATLGAAGEDLAATAAPDDSAWLERSLELVPAGQSLVLPAGRLTLDPALRSGRAGRTVLGAGSGTLVELVPPERSGLPKSLVLPCPDAGPVPPPCRIGRPEAVTLRGLAVTAGPPRRSEPDR